MSSQANSILQSDLDNSPLLLPAKVLRNDAEALQAAREVAEVAREQAARRDQQRKLPWKRRVWRSRPALIYWEFRQER